MALADLDRGQVARLWGKPTEQVGSVNDPRTAEDGGVKWNEKWIYRDADGAERWVLWLRYDLVGAFRVSVDGSPTPLELSGESSG